MIPSKPCTVRPEVAAAAKWWANQLRELPSFDNGSKDLGSQMAAFTMNMVRLSIPELPEEKIATFEQVLAEGMELVIESHSEDWRPGQPKWGCFRRHFGTDYQPDRVLEQAALAAGIDLSFRAPIKTRMWINPGSVMVVCGHGMPAQEVFTTVKGVSV